MPQLPPHVSRAHSLLSTPLFSRAPHDVNVHERINISHDRAKAVGIAYDLQAEDIMLLSRKFWDLWTDPIITIDGAATTLFLIHLNLAAGTLAPFVEKRPELQPLLDDMLAFKVSAQFLMTELGHGLDAVNMETTATLQEDGSLDLFTPTDNAAKYMPPTLPLGGLPRIGIVMARLIVHGVDHGIRPFIVPLNNGNEMCDRVVARELPTRCGTNPVGHALTYFNHVILPPEALLGDINQCDNARKQFLRCATRIRIGSVTVAALAVPVLRVSAYIVARYSSRRMQIAIAEALSQAAVLEALYAVVTDNFSNDDDDHAPAIFKALAFKFWRKSGVALTDTLGAQGLFDFNQVIVLDMEWRGSAVAEGDANVLSIRCAFELIAGKYKPPPSSHPQSYLARHERALIKEFRAMLFSLAGGKHREAAFGRKLMPRALELVQAIGDRMAYETAIAANVPQSLIELHEAAAILSASPWYIEHAGLSYQEQLDRKERAVTNVMAELERHLYDARIKDYATAAIVSEDSWQEFASTLKVFSGTATYNPYRPSVQARL